MIFSIDQVYIDLLSPKSMSGQAIADVLADHPSPDELYKEKLNLQFV